MAKTGLIAGLLLFGLLTFGCITAPKNLGLGGASCTSSNDCQENLVCLNNKCSEKPISTCYFQSAGFACYSYKIAANSSELSGLILDIGQGTGDDIAIIGFNCTTSETYLVHDFAGNNITIQSGSHKLLNGNSTDPRPLPCWKVDGTKISAQDAGQYYKGMVYIHYVDLETGLDHKIIGYIEGRIE
jgi:hypothetical protein